MGEIREGDRRERERGRMNGGRGRYGWSDRHRDRRQKHVGR